MAKARTRLELTRARLEKVRVIDLSGNLQHRPSVGDPYPTYRVVIVITAGQY